MTITIILDSLLFIVGLWIGVAGIVGWYRFNSRILILMGMGGLLVAGSVLLTILDFPGSSFITGLALLSMGLFNLLSAGSWHRRGITIRQIFLFAPIKNVPEPTQEHND